MPSSRKLRSWAHVPKGVVEQRSSASHAAPAPHAPQFTFEHASAASSASQRVASSESLQPGT